MKKLLNTSTILTFYLIINMFSVIELSAQMLKLPNNGLNHKSVVGRRVGVTDIEINWSAPGVKGREDKIWGSSVAPYGFTVLGFGSNSPSPWRAGADESTSIYFSTDVTINGKRLAAGIYGFFIALYQDSCTLIFNKNAEGWGSYFYKSEYDILRVTTIQKKNVSPSIERLNYQFSNQTDRSVDIVLEWEKWRIPFSVNTDLVLNTLASIQKQLSGAMGFDPPSLAAGAKWCLQNDVNTQEALSWINTATDPNLGALQTFDALSTKAGLLKKSNKPVEADQIMKMALEKATVFEMHGYGRQLLAEGNNKAALAVFEENHKKYKGAWPTNVGMMRGLSANGELKKALEYAKKALPQAPNNENKAIIEKAIETLSSGKPL